MSGPPRHADDLFRPLRPASGWRLVAAVILGPFAWFVAFTVVAWLVEKSDAVEIGLLITLGSFVVGLIALLVLRAGRNRERRRYDGS
jgi:Flp pilus assembly protein TadB